ncbi:sigma-70 family RNA polymerase sigma factor [Massilia sp. PAMC28688]|uniref:sigma-70 family RNA polymerase sigma factor n=1 Tax=Massilia sp. PAMC28688 TaxID=2861283 RepID=UPI001C6397B8|nr:sigma-70 family RNA polymerase sigma factor [Massilia sp. PAMC28688]QYF93684.1 sigma-70 family RNA polymerase sigma factor [Massilia sp. PAMC28688]
MSDSGDVRQLLEQVRQGDKDAFRALMAPYSRKLYLVILRIVKNSSDADDVMQEALLCAYRGLASFRGEAGFSTWLYRIGTNSALSFLAQRRRLQHDASGAGYDWRGAALAPPSDDPEQIMVGKQLLATIGSALDTMHPEYRTAIVLREFEGLSYDEIATAMVCPLGTVRSRIANARTAIGHQLKSQGFYCASVGA